MTDQMISTVPHQRVVEHAFTEPNTFLSETSRIPAADRALPGQRTMDEVPAQREDHED